MSRIPEHGIRPSYPTPAAPAVEARCHPVTPGCFLILSLWQKLLGEPGQVEGGRERERVREKEEEGESEVETEEAGKEGERKQ